MQLDGRETIFFFKHDYNFSSESGVCEHVTWILLLDKLAQKFLRIRVYVIASLQKIEISAAIEQSCKMLLLVKLK